MRFGCVETGFDSRRPDQGRHSVTTRNTTGCRIVVVRMAGGHVVRVRFSAARLDMESSQKEAKENGGTNLERATLRDLDVFLALEKKVSGSKIYSPTLDPEEAIREFETNVVYLIKKAGEAVGSIMYERKDKEHAYISGLAVDPQYQQQGIARTALLSILDELKDYKRIDLAVHPENERALKLYLSLGFKEESRKENYYGDGEPRLILAKVSAT